MKLVFDEQLFNQCLDRSELFTYCMTLQGDVFKQSPNRIVYRFIHNQEPYFIKIHQGVGWREIIKNLIQGKSPVLGAKQEWRALKRLQSLHIPALIPVGFGVRGLNPARQQSFIITKALQHTVNLEELTHDWRQHPPPLQLKRALIKALAHAVSAMHRAGINHRDCYLCHFRVHESVQTQALHPDAIHIVDLHRAQCRRRVPMRWLVKDLAGLYFSSLSLGLSSRDFLAFIKYYSGQSLREVLTMHRDLWSTVEKHAQALHAKQLRRRC